MGSLRWTYVGAGIAANPHTLALKALHLALIFLRQPRQLRHPKAHFWEELLEVPIPTRSEESSEHVTMIPFYDMIQAAIIIILKSGQSFKYYNSSEFTPIKIRIIFDISINNRI